MPLTSTSGGPAGASSGAADDDATSNGDDTTGGDLETTGDESDTSVATGRRVPAEWEPQEAVWMQWPGQWEVQYEPIFVDIIAAITAHERVHVVAATQARRNRASDQLAAAGIADAMVEFHVIPTDNAWMRDNGPRYVLVDGELTLQDWGFDAWGGNFGGQIPWEADDDVPRAVAKILGMPREDYALVHERGDLEFNGVDTLITSFSVLSDRNPGMTEPEFSEIFEEAFGVESVVYIEGFHPLDGTTGHVDGLARFVPSGAVVVGQISNPQQDSTTAELFDDIATQIATQRPDLDLERMPFPAHTDYMNWLVGNDFVVSGAFDDPEADAAAKARLEAYFPGREVTMVQMAALWADGGGVHCVTNDQPAWTLER
ncbi:MAG: agmatine deiminase family protein [Myxococcota bacterium]